MKIFLYRKLSAEFNQDIYIWDVDKTYLNTQFESLGGIFKTLLEFPIDKKDIPGARDLLLELRRGRGSQIALNPIFFISATPVQLKKILEAKFLLDGIQHDGIILKDYRWMRRHCGKLRFKNNFSYKLIALLSHRLNMPPSSVEYLFGDDFERDCDVYSVYADILKGEMDERKLVHYLKKEKLTPQEINVILSKASAILNLSESRGKNLLGHPKEIVQKIFIYTIKKSDPNKFLNYGERLVPTRNYVQTAAVLYELGKISKKGLERVAKQYAQCRVTTDWNVEQSMKDLYGRKLISNETYVSF